MANDILIKVGTRLVWADATDFGNSPYADTDQLLLAALANGAARQGAKGDFGEKRAKFWTVTALLEFDVAPTAGLTVDIYFAASPHATAGTSNPGGCSGSDAAYTGTAADTLAHSLPQLILIGSHVCTVDIATTVQQSVITGAFKLPHRYGMPVVVNYSGQALEGDDIEMSIIFEPNVDEIQT